jgi:CHAT domain-containing protein
VEENLPLGIIATGLQDLISCDGQFYMGCARCGREARVHYTLLQDPANRPKAACTACGAQVEGHIRHLFAEVWQCRSCDLKFEVSRAGYEPASCEKCGSHEVELLARELAAPFPPTFDQIAPAKQIPWGVLLEDDLAHMRGELGMMRDSLDFAEHLLLSVRFCQRLELANSYAAETIGIALPNERANLLLEHCRRNNSLDSGLAALALFNELSPEPPQLMDHYVAALVSDVLLVRFDEVTLAAAGHPTVRAEAVAHARAAVDLAQQVAVSSPEELLALAKMELLLSRLLAAGSASIEEKLEGIAVAERALNHNVLSPEGAEDVRATRAITIAELAELTEVDSALLDEASATLERNVASLKAAGNAESLWKRAYDLGKLYDARGRLKDAIRLLRESADAVLSLLVKCGSPEMLATGATEYLYVFETLAAFLAEDGRGREALAACETLRGAVPRMANSESQRTHAAVRLGIKMLAAARDPHYQPNDVPAFSPPDIEDELRKIYSSLLGQRTALLYYSWSDKRVTALLIHADPTDASTRVDSFQWHCIDIPVRRMEEDLLRTMLTGEGDPRIHAPTWLNAMTYAMPGPGRNVRLTLAARESYQYLFAPIEQRVRALGVNRLAICTAGLLTAVSFETLTTRERPSWSLADDFEICYLPSLGIASNLAQYGAPAGKRLLIIGYSGTDLPGIDAEVDAIRSKWQGEINVLRGANLTKKTALTALAQGFDFIHFAGHGSFDLESPSKSAFYFAGGADGTPSDSHRLTAEDLLRIKLTRHPLVTLSACSSLLYSDAHRLTGLPGSLLEAGAAAIIGSRWPVADKVALRLMGDIYAAIAGGATPFGAFVQAQRAMRATYEVEDWGAFSYLGLPPSSWVMPE